MVGGLLPPGASRALFEGEPAVSGNGAWIAITNALAGGAEVAARYEAGDGTIVRPALPAGWAHEPVSDADEPCSACGAVTWEHVTPTDGSRGMSRSNGGPLRPSAVVVCLRCGHEVHAGAWSGPGRASFAFWRTLRDVRVRWRRHERPSLAKLKFPVIQAAEPFDWGPGSNAARALRIHARRRAVAARVAGAESFAFELRLDGVPVRFTGLRDRAGWAAAGDTTKARIVLAVSGIEPDNVALHRL